MKKTFVEWVVIVAICVLGVGTAFGRNIGDAYRLVYNILDSSGTPVAGQNVTLKIQKASNGYWFDFNDSTFKNESWSNKSVSLSEDTTEHQYYYDWTPPGSETAAEQYAFVVDNGNTTYKDHQIKIVEYQDIGNSTYAGGAVASVSGAVGSVTGNVGGNVNGTVVGNVTVTNCDVAVSTRGTSNLTTSDLSNLDVAVSTRGISNLTTTDISDSVGTLNNISAADVRNEMDTNSTKLTAINNTVQTNLDEKVSTRSDFNASTDYVQLNGTKVL